MTKQTLLSLAQKGNSDAIAALMNKAFVKKKIAATTRLEGNCLQVKFTSEQIPPQDVCVYVVYEGMSSLKVPSIQSIRVIGQQRHQPEPAWIKTLELPSPDSTPDATPASVSPPPVEPQPQPTKLQGRKPLLWLGCIVCVLGIVVAALGTAVRFQVRNSEATLVRNSTSLQEATPPKKAAALKEATSPKKPAALQPANPPEKSAALKQATAPKKPVALQPANPPEKSAVLKQATVPKKPVALQPATPPEKLASSQKLASVVPNKPTNNSPPQAASNPPIQPKTAPQPSPKTSQLISRQASNQLTLKKTIVGQISPKSVVYSGKDLFFAQNMMYSHTITVYNRQHKLVKTIPDTVNLAKFGYPKFKGNYRGAPVEVSFSHKGQYAWVSNYQMYGRGFNNPGSDRCNPSQRKDPSFLYRINTKTLKVEKVIQVGSVPKFVATSPDNRLVLVSNWCSWDLSVVDTQKNQEIKRIKLGAYPRGTVVDSASKKAYVAVMGSYNIAQVDLKNFDVNWIRNVGRSPRHLNIDPAGKYLYASLNGEGKIAKIAIPQGQVIGKAYTGAAPRSMVLSQDGQKLYVVNYGNNTVSKVRTSDMKVLQTVNVASHPIGITYDPQTREVWVACYSGRIMVFQD